ncbi:MAG TPA: flagellar hook-basal body complex protein FliE [Syntrophomonas sp.]|nr:flagellar hook-basal body complex protein FliE [Syntrophomonas sp.]
MNIADVSSILKTVSDPVTGMSNQVQNQSERSFSQILTDQLEEADKLQKNSDRLIEAFLIGEPVEIHEMMIAAEKADLAIRQTVEIRNRVIDAYKQITNMQI